MSPIIRRLAVMTSGGDAPGMNPCIRAVVRTAIARNLEVWGVEDGYEGLINGNFIRLGARDVSGILQKGGTILRSARSEQMMQPSGQIEAVRQLNSQGIDAAVIIGGDGSLRGAKVLAERGMAVMGIPASIDNDIYGTDMCIGVDTALNTIVEAIDKIRDTASSHSRAFLVETIGRNSGYLALMAGINSGAEMVLIPEVPTTVDEIINTVKLDYQKGKQHCIIVVAEGFEPDTNELARIINEKDVGFRAWVTILGHLQRGGTPSAFDRWLATRFGVRAVEFLLDGQRGMMTALNGNRVVTVPLQEVVSQRKETPTRFYEIAEILAR